MNSYDKVIAWLLDGDPAIRWQTRRDLLSADEAEWQHERGNVATEGWGARLLALQDDAGTWAKGLYSPKWISTTYTMMLLRRMGLP
ncbi:MAG TPA: squalene cyclase, partial [bacterium]|nr:squalene cyclase [bacterium]